VDPSFISSKYPSNIALTRLKSPTHASFQAESGVLEEKAHKENENSSNFFASKLPLPKHFTRNRSV